jgi:L-amino acid N-acyltransferase
MLTIRTASIKDISAIKDIYNWAIENTTGTFDTELKTIENRTAWFVEREEQFIILVAEINTEIAGYIALNKWSERKAYDITAEVSFYVKPEFQGKGIGKKLLTTAIKFAEETKLVSLISRITEGNEQSIHLHKMAGFETIGIMKKAGIKFGKLLDVTLMQLVF